MTPDCRDLARRELKAHGPCVFFIYFFITSGTREKERAPFCSPGAFRQSLTVKEGRERSQANKDGAKSLSPP